MIRFLKRLAFAGLLLTLCSCHAPSNAVNDDASWAADPSIEFRLARAEPAPGLVRMEVLGTDRVVYVEDRVFISNKHIKNVQWGYGPVAGVVIIIRLTESGRERFSAMTAQGIGKRAAVIVNSRLISAPVIRVAVTGGWPVTVDITLPREQAERVAKAISAGWPERAKEPQ